MHDPVFLARKAETATKEDIEIAKDLLETLVHHQDGCVGMAANMIGELKRIIAFDNDGEYMVMFNPVIIKKDTPYQTEEGCLSLEGVRPTMRYENIEVEYFDFAWKKQRMKLNGWTAQICQHEVDHLSGRII
jgi:peptide deformylase